MASIDVATDGAATVICINRPEARNALSSHLWAQLDRVFADLRETRRPVIIRGAGEQAFSAGSDLAEFASMSIADVNSTFMLMEDVIARVERLPVPIIAHVGGYALGSALELVCACDIQVAAEHAVLGMPVARLGIMLTPAFVRRIAALIGPGWTRYLLVTGRLLNATESHRIGLVHEVVPREQHFQRCQDLAAQISNHSLHSVRAAKESMLASLPTPAPGASGPPYYIHEEDFREGVAAFLARRPPRFAGQ